MNLTMKKILVTGAGGQIGTELVPALRERYGIENVMATDILADFSGELANGPSRIVDVTSYECIESAVKNYGATHIFHLASILSARGEENPHRAYRVNIDGLHNILEVARENGLEQVVYPSSIAAFGPETPKENTPNETIQKPTTIYGISKVFGELLGDYYSSKFGLDVRGLRFPGIISWKVEPTNGTTDYAAQMCFSAVRKGCYSCYLKEDTKLPMMYMPDAIRALIELSEADQSRLEHKTNFNVNAMSFAPFELEEAIRREIPEFSIRYKIDQVKQAIADSWPNSLDDSAAREEWGWKPEYGLEEMVNEMIKNLNRRFEPQENIARVRRISARRWGWTK